MKDIIVVFEQPEIEIIIEEPSNIIGLFVGKNSDEYTGRINVIHQRPHLKSLTTIKAVLYDESKFDLEANLVIEKGARYTDSYLKIDVLMMSDKAKTRAVPSLEIMEDEVKGGHGATVGEVDEQELFYMMSRGLDRMSAEEEIVTGFIAGISEKIRNAPQFT